MLWGISPIFMLLSWGFWALGWDARWGREEPGTVKSLKSKQSSKITKQVSTC